MSKTWKDISDYVRPYLDRKRGGVENWRRGERHRHTVMRHVDFDDPCDRQYVWRRYGYLGIPEESDYAALHKDGSVLLINDGRWSEKPLMVEVPVDDEGNPVGGVWDERPSWIDRFPLYADFMIAEKYCPIIMSVFVPCSLPHSLEEDSDPYNNCYKYVERSHRDNRSRERVSYSPQRSQEREVLGMIRSQFNTGGIDNVDVDADITLPRTKFESSVIV